MTDADTFRTECRSGAPAPIFSVLIVAFHVAAVAVPFLGILQQRIVHLFSFLLVWAAAGVVDRSASVRSRSLASVSAVLAAWAGFVFLTGSGTAGLLEKGLYGPRAVETAAGVVLIVLVLGLSRRTIGISLPIVCLVFLAFAVLGPFLPPVLAHKGHGIGYLAGYLAWTTEGIFGMPVGAAASYIVLFVFFGELLIRFGGGTFFLDMTKALSRRFRFGPAGSAVLASALFGSVNGSAVANVVTTGSFTIPVMRKHGFPPEYAAAVEAVASTGGQLLPPVMGSVAFVMADLAGIPYSRILSAAFLPGILYYAGLWVSVSCTNGRLGLRTAGESDRVPFGLAVRRGWFFLLPFAVLLCSLFVLNVSVSLSAVYTVFSVILVGAARTVFLEKRLPWKELSAACGKTVAIAIPVSAACAAAGLVIGIIGMTGIGVRFSRILIGLTTGSVFPIMFLTMASCLVLGTALPSSAAFVMCAAIGVPALVGSGVPLLGANLFILYFAILSFITPPVAMSVYAAAGLARARFRGTGILALRLAFSGFIIPFMFVFHPGILTVDAPVLTILFDAVLAAVAVALVSIGLAGWLGKNLHPAVRVLMVVLAIALVVPDAILNSVSLAGSGITVLALLRAAKRGVEPSRADDRDDARASVDADPHTRAKNRGRP